MSQTSKKLFFPIVSYAFCFKTSENISFPYVFTDFYWKSLLLLSKTNVLHENSSESFKKPIFSVTRTFWICSPKSLKNWFYWFFGFLLKPLHTKNWFSLWFLLLFQRSACKTLVFLIFLLLFDRKV